LVGDRGERFSLKVFALVPPSGSPWRISPLPHKHVGLCPQRSIQVFTTRVSPLDPGHDVMEIFFVAPGLNEGSGTSGLPSPPFQSLKGPPFFIPKKPVWPPCSSPSWVFFFLGYPGSPTMLGPPPEFAMELRALVPCLLTPLLLSFSEWD